MDLLIFIFMAVILVISDGLIVHGPSGPLVAPLGSSVVLPCYVDEPLPMEGLKVEWRRSDSEALVHLYQDGERQAEAQQQDYHDRAYFFTDQIQHGNFSLRLDNLRAEDEGEYTCKVHSQQDYGETVLQIKVSNVGFSVLHLTVLILCIAASGSALLLCCLIYCRSQNKVFCLQMFLVFCPNILMFLAFVFWGVSEGSLNESVSCSALYFMRPLMLLWAAPYINEFTGKIKTLFLYDSYLTEYVAFSTVFYSVLFKSTWDKSMNYKGFDSIMITVLFMIMLLFHLFYIIIMLGRFIQTLSELIFPIFSILVGIIVFVLPTLQFVFLYYAFGSVRGGFFIVAVLPIFLTVTNYNWDVTFGERMGCSPLVRRTVWVVFMLLVNFVIVCFYIIALKTQKDHFGLACMSGFLQLLWTVINFTYSFEFEIQRIVPVYLFGSVGVILLNSVTLMTELILKTVNGDRSVGDLRVVVFSSEFLFTLFLLILMAYEPWIKTCLLSRQKARTGQTPASGSQNQDSQNANQNTAESHEMNLLKTEDQEAGRSDEMEKTQPDLVESQT